MITNSESFTRVSKKRTFSENLNIFKAVFFREFRITLLLILSLAGFLILTLPYFNQFFKAPQEGIDMGTYTTLSFLYILLPSLYYISPIMLLGSIMLFFYERDRYLNYEYNIYSQKETIKDQKPDYFVFIRQENKKPLYLNKFIFKYLYISLYIVLLVYIFVLFFKLTDRIELSNNFYDLIAAVNAFALMAIWTIDILRRVRYKKFLKDFANPEKSIALDVTT